MSGPLVDTSVLVDYFGGRVSPEGDLLQVLLDTGPPPTTAPIIVQEFLQGLSRPSDVARGQDYLQRFIQLPPPDYDVHARAAALHRALKKQGFVTGTVDALVVAIAEAAGVPMLTSDAVQTRLCKQAGVLAL